MAIRKLLVLASLSLALLPKPTRAQDKFPDMILVNGRIFTAVDLRPYAEAIAITGEHIMAVDTTQKITALAGPKTKRIDLHGRLVIPGIMDTHNHYHGDPIPDSVNIDFGEPPPSCAKALQTLEEKVRSTPGGKVITGNIGIQAFFEPDCTPAALDRIAPNNPVVLMGPTPHLGMLNQAAVKRFHIDTSAPPPLAGYYGKDMKSQKWDGVVQDSAFLAIGTQLVTDGTSDDERLR